MLVSGVQQSQSAVHIHISTTPLFYIFFSHADHYRMLSGAPCAVQQILINYLFFCVVVYVHRSQSLNYVPFYQEK